ncbi:MAG TPA: protein-L-isoaspartate(D-aspartate) O-methyltransferase [Flavobacteriales bacterium]|nr:protein-L-isoaspartate(D-aspartate) O-methyltransferase [Flavobacteriales bacterium]HPH83570.1 protein-L-isoaspartate(D-aspartate) O-methyltransferase [Flavobacteriales bacterium]
MPDSYRLKGLRNRLVDELRAKGIMSEPVLDAIRAVPRHQFFQDLAFMEKAYEDIAFQIGAGQTISHPSTVAFQTQLLELKSGEKVLEIGTGSGYQTAVLAQFGVKIFSIERQHALYIRTKKHLELMNISARLFFGDGYLGQPAFAPFDKILVTAGAPFIPQALTEQLKPGGRLVIPVGVDGKQVMHVIDKQLDGTLQDAEHGEFRFVPLLESKS